MVGVIALVCVGTSVVLQVRGFDDKQALMATGAFMRVGLVMAALWLALPTKNRPAAWANMSPWVLWGMLGLIVTIAARPRIALYAIPWLIVLAVIGRVLRPRSKHRPGPGPPAKAASRPEEHQAENVPSVPKK
jgi:hypothetical protein